MKRNIRNRLIGGLLAGTLLAMSFGATAQTTQTASGTTISNQATVDYKVGTVSQPQKTSNTLEFVVDAKLSLSVTKADTSITTVSPGQSQVVLTYTVTNLGNDAQGAVLQASNVQAGVVDPFGSVDTDNFDVTNPTVHVDKPGTGAGSYSSTNDTATDINTIAANGGTATVFVVFDVPTSAADAAIAAVDLQARVGKTATNYGDTVSVQPQTSTTAAWNPNSVQYVYVDTAAATAVTGVTDGANDGYASALNAVNVASATIAITKTVEVVSDPSGNTPARAIPGAVMKYTITVSNSGGTAASDVSVSDDLHTEIDAGHFAYVTGSLTAAANGTAISPCTEASDTDGCKYDATSGSEKVTVGSMTVDAGKTAVVTFEVTLK